MALTTTTLASAAGVSDTVLVVAASTGFSAGYVIRLGDEVCYVAQNYSVGLNGVNIPVRRGQDGTLAVAHPVTSNVTVGAASDTAWGAIGASTTVQYPLAGRTRRMLEYGAAGAITHPDPGTDMVAILNGTVALAMTLADPSKDLDGSILIVTGNGAAAHTLTIAGGIGGGAGSYDVLTWAAGAKSGVALIAANGSWNPLTGVLAGNTTNVTLTIA